MDFRTSTSVRGGEMAVRPSVSIDLVKRQGPNPDPRGFNNDQTAFLQCRSQLL
jgi:hypothetical protein